MARPRKPGSGGPREGTPGTSYTNRSDLNQHHAPTQPITVAPAKIYGDATAQREAQQAMPLPATTAIHAPTERPAEPLTAGMAQGAGAGPEAVQAPMGSALTPIDELRAIYRNFPTEELRKLIEYG